MKLSRRTTTLRPRCVVRRIPTRSGLAHMEAVMTTAVMVPLTVALFLMGMKACNYFYQIISTLVSWPYL